MTKRKEDFGFREPQDLLAKLRHDIARYKSLIKADMNVVSYAAFDCAVAAWSLADWAWVAFEGGKRQELIKRLGGNIANKGQFHDRLFVHIPGFQVCYHLATFAKHFGVDRKPVDDLLLTRTFSWQGDPDKEPPDAEKLLAFHTQGEMFIADELFDRIAFEWTKLLRGL
jgi:hypothetical protein